MKRKVSLTLEESVILHAKALARRRGVSLSALIEHLFHEQAGAGGAPFSTRWSGKFRSADRADARFRGLARKYS